MKLQNTVFILAAVMACFGAYKIVSRERPSIAEQELVEQLNTSTPSLNSTISLRTALMSMLNKTKTEQGAPDGQAIAGKESYANSRSYLSMRQSIRRDNELLAKRKFSSREVDLGEKYFENLVSSKPTARLYEKSKEIFGNSPEGIGAAKWITLGVRLETSPQFAAAFEMATQAVNQNPDAVLEKINKSIATIRADPFIYQMTFNLAFRLNTDLAQLTRFFGQEFEQQLKYLTAKPSDSFWVSKVALMLAQQAGITGEDLKPYFKRGIDASKGSPQILLDFKRTAQYHFPGTKL